MCMIDGADSCEFLSKQIRLARKPHRCSECGRSIEPGEQYETYFGKAEGDTFRGATCQHCIAVRGWLVAVCGGFLYGGVFDDLHEHIDADLPENNPRWLYIATSGIQHKWRAKDGTMRRVMSLPKNMPTPERLKQLEERGDR